MASSQAELTLLLTAKNLADSAVSQVGDAVDAVKRKTGEAAHALGEMGSSLAAGLGNLTENLLTGQDFGTAAINLGAFMAGEMVQEFGGKLAAQMAGSLIVQTIAGSLASFGATVGGLISAAIPVGMALWPVLLVGAIAAGIIFLIHNPEVAHRILEFAQGFVSGILRGIAALPGLMLDFVRNLLALVAGLFVTGVTSIVGLWLSIPLKLAGLGLSIVTTIVRGMVSLPGKIADVIRDAFSNLKIDIGPFHIRSSGVTIDLPKIDIPQVGGTYGNSQNSGGRFGTQSVGTPVVIGAGGGGTSGVRILGVSQDDILDMVDRGLYFRLASAAPAATGNGS